MNAIVVGTDGSPGAEAAVQKAIELVQVAVGAGGHGELRRFMLGSVPVKLAHHARRSLLIVQEPEG